MRPVFRVLSTYEEVVMRKRHVTIGAAIVTTAMLLAGCSGGGAAEYGPVQTDPSGDGETLTLWHYESETSAMGVAWEAAIAQFEEETGATVEFEPKAFEQIRSTASQVLNSDAAPDILEYNKGNATAGLLASQGLLTPLDEAAEAYGWTDKLAESLQTTTKYDEDGVMGSGSMYGVPNYGEFVDVYYNVDAFAQYNIAVPTTFDEFVAALETFKQNGVTPLAEAAGEYPLGQLWYQLALMDATREWVTDFQTYTGEVDFHDENFTFATETIKEWVDAGYISEDVTGLKAEDAGVNFINGTNPIFYSGSWWYGRFVEEVTDFQWSSFLFPGSEMAPGSSGNLWVVPENSEQKDLAYKFIDITMSPEIQALIGNNGGIPVAAEAADITDEKSKELINNFNTVTERDGLAFYPDWPTATFYDELNAGLQELVNGTLTADEVLTQLGEDYEAGVADIR
jgi:raffinose/stachyose/melibiose transport system substrate-binding protein